MSTVEVALNSPPALNDTTDNVFRASSVRSTDTDQSPPAVVEAVTELAPPVTITLTFASPVPVRVMGSVDVDCVTVVMTGVLGGAARAVALNPKSESRTATDVTTAATLFLPKFIMFITFLINW